MDLKELKKLANALDDSGKQELIYFLQSRTKDLATPNRAIDEIQEQKHKDGLVCQHCDNHSVVRFGKYAIKTRTTEVKRQRYPVNPAVKRSTTSPTPLFNAPEDLTFGFDSSNV
jgi:hypothetical protein